METGVNQFVNNDINREVAPGAFGGGDNQGQGEKKDKFW